MPVFRYKGKRITLFKQDKEYFAQLPNGFISASTANEVVSRAKEEINKSSGKHISESYSSREEAKFSEGHRDES